MKNQKQKRRAPARQVDNKKDPSQAKLGIGVRLLRAKAKLTQEALANKCGMARTYLADIERGARNVSLSNVCRIAKSFGQPAHALLKVSGI